LDPHALLRVVLYMCCRTEKPRIIKLANEKDRMTLFFRSQASERSEDGVVDHVVYAQPSVIIAGHYSIAPHMAELSHQGRAEHMSFVTGARLVRRALALGHTSHLVLWINDIGVAQAEREHLKGAYALPEDYRSIVAAEQLDPSRLDIMFESSTRNKASTLLRKLYKNQPYLFERVHTNRQDLVRCVNDDQCGLEGDKERFAYIVRGPGGEHLVVKEGPNPKCNFILATLFEQVCKRYAPRTVVNIFNELYAYRLSLGLHVAKAILNNRTPFVNLLCDGTRLYPLGELDPRLTQLSTTET
jgi:hypothetical protein